MPLTRRERLQQLGMEATVLYSMLPNTMSNREKFQTAKKYVRTLYNTSFRKATPQQRETLLRVGAEVLDDDPSKSYTNAPVNDNAKNTPRPSPSQYQTRQECVQNYVNNGYSVAAANTACNEFFPPRPSTVGGTTTRTANWGKGGGKSTITTTYPTKTGFKKASKEDFHSTPSWAAVAGGDLSHLSSTPSVSNIKSAKTMSDALGEAMKNYTYNKAIYQDSVLYDQKPIPKYTSNEKQLLKSAKEQREKPAWMRALDW